MYVDLVKADKIHITVEQFHRVIAFVEQRKPQYFDAKTGRYTNIVFPINEAQIFVKGWEQTWYFKHHDGKVKVFYKFKDQYPMTFTADFTEGTIIDAEFSSSMNDEEFIENAGRIVETLVFLSVYIADYKEVKERVSHKKTLSTPNKTNQKNKKKRPIKIGVYYINDHVEPTGKNPHQWHTESWSVRGHWRQNKSGKRSWIRPHNKGTGSRVAREYTI